MHNYRIDPAKVAIGVLPLGTGNDFSQYLGWGKEKSMVVGEKYRNLKKLIRRWLLAKEEDFDIWDMVAEVHEVLFYPFSVANFRKSTNNPKAKQLRVRPSAAVSATTLASA